MFVMITDMAPKHCVIRSGAPHVSFPSRDVAMNMTMELGIVNVSLAISDIIQTLISNLPDILASNIVFSPERIDELSIKYEGETRQARYCHQYCHHVSHMSTSQRIG